MFLSYLIEISLLWLLLEATAPAFQRRILRDFFPGLPPDADAVDAHAAVSGTSPGGLLRGPGGSPSPAGPGGPEQTNSTSREGFADADTHLTGRAGSVRPEF